MRNVSILPPSFLVRKVYTTNEGALEPRGVHDHDDIIFNAVYFRLAQWGQYFYIASRAQLHEDYDSIYTLMPETRYNHIIAILS